MNDIFDTMINFMKCIINQKLIQVKQYFHVSQDKRRINPVVVLLRKGLFFRFKSWFQIIG